MALPAHQQGKLPLGITSMQKVQAGFQTSRQAGRVDGFNTVQMVGSVAQSGQNNVEGCTCELMDSPRVSPSDRGRHHAATRRRCSPTWKKQACSSGRK